MNVKDIVIKDVKKVIYDRKTLMLIIVMPIILATILGAALKGTFTAGGGFTEAKPIAIVKEYDSKEEKEKLILKIKEYIPSEQLQQFEEDISNMDADKIIAEVFEDEDVKKIVSVKEMNYEEAEKDLKNGKVNAIIVFPKNFVYNTYMNFTPRLIKNKVEIKTIKTAEDKFSGMIADSIADGFVNSFEQIMVNKETFINIARKYVPQGKYNQQLMDMLQSDEDNREYIEIKSKSIEGKKQMDSFGYYVIAILTMFLFYSAGIGGRTLLLEKREYTYQRITVAGIKVNKMYIGVFFTSFFVALIQVTVMLVYSAAVLRVVWGNYLYVLLSTFFVITAIASMGLLIATITLRSDNFKFANFFENILVFFMALIGGSYVPVSILPKIFQQMSGFSINGLGIKMYSNIMLGEEFGANYEAIVRLIIMSVVFIICAVIVDKTKKEVA